MGGVARGLGRRGAQVGLTGSRGGCSRYAQESLIPLLPNYGKTLGSDRSFCESLKWTAANPRKSMNLGNSTYKSHIMAPKDLIDGRAASLIDENPGIIKIKEESKDLSGFEEGCIQSVPNF